MIALFGQPLAGKGDPRTVRGKIGNRELEVPGARATKD
jgi:hypothetical protein